MKIKSSIIFGYHENKIKYYFRYHENKIKYYFWVPQK